MSEPLLLCRRLAPAAAGAPPPALVLSLTASERQRLRGHGRSICGRDLLLQLPRGAALEPGEWLAAAEGPPLVRVEAAPEELLRVRSDDPFTLLRAAYHLGNRHVALELGPGELRLLQDSVLAELLRGLGVATATITAPFQPERGAYGHSHVPGAAVQEHTGSNGSGHHHDDGNSDVHGNSHVPGNSDVPGNSHGSGNSHDAGNSRGPTPSHGQRGNEDPGQGHSHSDDH